jgi:hypothetical protein
VLYKAFCQCQEFKFILCQQKSFRSIQTVTLNEITKWRKNQTGEETTKRRSRQNSKSISNSANF